VLGLYIPHHILNSNLRRILKLSPKNRWDEVESMLTLILNEKEAMKLVDAIKESVKYDIERTIDRFASKNKLTD
jgi:hypothetical protein